MPPSTPLSAMATGKNVPRSTSWAAAGDAKARSISRASTTVRRMDTERFEGASPVIDEKSVDRGDPGRVVRVVHERLELGARAHAELLLHAADVLARGVVG